MIKEELGEDKFRFYCNDIDWDDDYVNIEGDLKLSMSLSDSSSIATNISKYLNDSVASLNKNTNFDETNKRIC